MFDVKISRSLDLMQEAASLTTVQGASAIKVQLVNISVTGISFVTPERLHVRTSTQYSMRFTLPGKSRLHFALVSLLPMIVPVESGYRYDAEFVRTDPQTVDHIIQCLNPVPMDVPDGATLHLY